MREGAYDCPARQWLRTQVKAQTAMMGFDGARVAWALGFLRCGSDGKDARSSPGRRGVVLDVHCHVLPNVDDGAATLEESLGMARFCVQDGISHVVATPHHHRYTRPQRADILGRVAHLNDELAGAAVPLTVLPGSEVQVTDTSEYRRDFEAGRYCHLGNGRAFTLLEFSWQDERYPPEAPELIGWLRGHGMTAIVAHPERQDCFARDPARLRALVDAGAWLQVTVDSLLGNYGPTPQSAGELLLRTYPEAVLASDAHSLRRCSGLPAGFAWVRDRLGAERCEDLKARADRVLSALLGRVQPVAPARRGSPPPPAPTPQRIALRHAGARYARPRSL